MSAETGVFWTLGAVGVAGQFMGMPVDLLLIGGVVGAAMLGRHRATTRMNGITTILLSAILAASLAPHLPKIMGIGEELILFLGIVIAAAWPYLVLELWPLIKKFARNWTGSGKP